MISFLSGNPSNYMKLAFIIFTTTFMTRKEEKCGTLVVNTFKSSNSNIEIRAIEDKGIRHTACDPLLCTCLYCAFAQHGKMRHGKGISYSYPSISLSTVK